MPDTTEMQKAFAVAYVANGGNASEAAKTAGYSEVSARQQASALLAKPHVMAEIHAEQGREIKSLASLAVRVVKGILEDPQAHPKLRLDAAKTILDRSGHVAPKAAEPETGLTRPMNEWSVQELEAFVNRAREAFARVDDNPNPSSSPEDEPSVH